jgi:hypothetical protein
VREALILVAIAVGGALSGKPWWFAVAPACGVALFAFGLLTHDTGTSDTTTDDSLGTLG